MRFRLNGAEVEYSGPADRTLLVFLREERGLRSLKNGCSEGACGCCTVQLGARAVLACRTPMNRVDGREVRTLEGFTERQRAVFARAFLLTGGVQCGFCTPGIVVRVKVLLDHHPDPRPEEVREALAPHLCRCTGYVKIVEAALLAARLLREGGDLPEVSAEGFIGIFLPRYQGEALVLGERAFVRDLKVPGMLHGALRLADHPRAVVRQLRLSPAFTVEGVRRIFTAQDVPGERLVGSIVRDWPVFVAEGELTRCVGDVLAGVVATSEEAARRAAAAIEVEYEVLPPVSDVETALGSEAPVLHLGGNLLYDHELVRGRPEEALEASAHVARGVYHTQRVEHAFLEPEASLAVPAASGSPHRLTVHSQSQGVYEDRAALARLLDLPEHLLNVIQVPAGGAFGGKEDLTVQAHAALYALLLHEPVMVALSREESLRVHPKRHPMTLRYALGCDDRGRLTALVADILADTGAYASVGMKVVERALGHSAGAYVVPNVRVRGRAVYTNNLPCGAMRGFGVPQVTFAVEGCIDELCAQGGFDRWQFRYDNAIRDGERTITGQRLDAGVGLRRTLEAVREDFTSARYAGIACGLKNVGVGNGKPDIGRCKLSIVAPGRVVLHHGWSEMGQGLSTVAIQALCQETGLSPSQCEVRVETAEEVRAGMTTSSRGTSLLGHGIIAASKFLSADLARYPLAELVGREYRGEWACEDTTAPEDETDEPVTHYSYGYATQVVLLDDEGRIGRVLAAHDVGRVINPVQLEGQLEGSIHMGLGYALSEELRLEQSRLVSDKLGRCGVLRAWQMPAVEVRLLEVPDPRGPFGAKGVGEIGVVPTAAAVASALRAYDGIQRTTLPIAEDRLPQRQRLQSGRL